MGSNTRSGTTENIFVSTPTDLMDAPRSRAGKRDASAYITEAVCHQSAMDGLSEVVAAHEVKYGPLGEEEIQSAHQDLFGGPDTTDAAEDTA